MWAPLKAHAIRLQVYETGVSSSALKQTVYARAELHQTARILAYRSGPPTRGGYT